MFSACFQISTDSRMSGKKKNLRFLPLKIYLSITIKISKRSEDQNCCTILKFYSAPHSVSEVTIKLKEAQDSPLRQSQPLIIFSTGEFLKWIAHLLITPTITGFLFHMFVQFAPESTKICI